MQRSIHRCIGAGRSSSSVLLISHGPSSPSSSGCAENSVFLNAAGPHRCWGWYLHIILDHILLHLIVYVLLQGFNYSSFEAIEGHSHQLLKRVKRVRSCTLSIVVVLHREAGTCCYPSSQAAVLFGPPALRGGVQGHRRPESRPVWRDCCRCGRCSSIPPLPLLFSRGQSLCPPPVRHLGGVLLLYVVHGGSRIPGSDRQYAVVAV